MIAGIIGSVQGVDVDQLAQAVARLVRLGPDVLMPDGDLMVIQRIEGSWAI